MTFGIIFIAIGIILIVNSVKKDDYNEDEA